MDGNSYSLEQLKEGSLVEGIKTNSETPTPTTTTSSPTPPTASNKKEIVTNKPHTRSVSQSKSYFN